MARSMYRPGNMSWVPSAAGWQLILLVALLIFLATVMAPPAFAAPQVAWNQTYRLENDSQGTSVVAVDDGYVVTGWLATNGGSQALLLKTDLAGRVVWQKTFGRYANNIGRGVRQTRDGGFIIVGDTGSLTYDSSDIYLIKTDSSGNEQWNKTYGGVKTDWGYSVWPTSDNGYVITGRTCIQGHNDTDIYLLKVDENGAEQWSKAFGGAQNDWGVSVQQTRDGGYIVAGVSDSCGACYLVKTDGSGYELWNKTCGPANLGWVSAVQQTSDGGYILTGTASSYGRGNDAYLVKTDSEGKEQWIKTYGGDSSDYGNCILQMPDGGYLVSGITYSFGNPSGGVYLVKTDERGNLQWNATYGGNISISGDSSLQLTADGGCIVVGSTTSYHQVYGRLLTRDKSYYQDLFLLKLDNVTSAPAPAKLSGIVGGSVAIAESRPVVATGDGYLVGGTISFDQGRDPNHSYYTAFDVYPYLLKTDLKGDVLWTKVYDKLDTLGFSGEINAVAPSADGYLLAASCGNADTSEIYLLKTSRDGNVVWAKTYGGPNTSYLASSVVTLPDGYVVAGNMRALQESAADCEYLLKLDHNGNFLWLKVRDRPTGSAIQSLAAVEDGYVLVERFVPDIDNVETQLTRTDLDGALAWDRRYVISGGADTGNSVVAVKDGYAIAGVADKYRQIYNQSHIFLMKTDPDGNKEWNVTFTGTTDDQVSGLLNLSDGYLIVGQNNLEGKAGKANQSLHLIRTDMSGNTVWDKAYSDFIIPATPAGQVNASPIPILIVTPTPVPAAMPAVNATSTPASSPSSPATPAQTTGFSSALTAITLALVSLVMLSGLYFRKGGDRQ